MEQTLLDGIRFQTSVVNAEIGYFDCGFFHLDHLYVAVFISVYFPDTQTGEQQTHGKPGKHQFPVRRLAVEKCVSHGFQKEGHGVVADQPWAVRRRNAGGYIIENSGQIKDHPQRDIDHIGEVLHKDAVMEQMDRASEGKQKEQGQDRNKIQNIPGERHLPGKHHEDDNCEGDHHFKAVYPDPDQDQDVFGKIDFGNNGFVVFYDFDTSGHHPAEEIPHGQTDENEHRKIRFSCLKYGAENKGIDQHKA